MGKSPQTSASSDRSSWPREALIFALVAVMSWYFVYLRYRLNQEFPLATLDSFLNGTAHKPFQFRMLVPWLVGGLRGLGLGDALTLYKAVDVVAVIGGYYSLRYYLGLYIRALAPAMAFALFYALPWNYLLARDIMIILPYDLMAVTLTTLALALVAREKWALFYPVFLAGTLNRETILFVTVAYVVAMWKQKPKSQLAIHAIAQLAIWIGIKALMAAMYPDNPGQTFEYFHVGSETPHWRTNLNVLTGWPHLVLVLSSFGFLWAIIPFGWRRLADSFPKRALWVTLPYILMVLLIGNLNEIRVFGELLPFVVVPALMIAASWLRENVT